MQFSVKKWVGISVGFVFVLVIQMISVLIAPPARATNDFIVAVVGPSGVQSDLYFFQNRVVPGFGPNNGMTDTTGHDTEVASVILNRAPYVKIMPIVRDWCAGVDYAVNNGVKVIAFVMISYWDIPCLKDAIVRAVNADIVVLAGVGNDGTERTTGIYPADYNRVIGVGSVDMSNWRPWWATVGPSTDLVAYGDQIGVIRKDGSWGYSSGSSYATANLAGVTAYYRYTNPNLNACQIIDKLKQSAIDLGAPGKDWWFGNGLVK